MRTWSVISASDAGSPPTRDGTRISNSLRETSIGSDQPCTPCNCDGRSRQDLLVGIHGHYRNPRAHSNRINREEDLNDFLDAMSLFSYIHKRLDTARQES